MLTEIILSICGVILFSARIPEGSLLIYRTQTLRRIKRPNSETMVSLTKMKGVLYSALRYGRYEGTEEQIWADIERFAKFAEEGNTEEVLGIMTQLANKGMGYRTLAKSLLSLAKVAENPAQFLEGLQFIQGLDYPWPELEVKRDFSLHDTSITKKIDLLSYPRLADSAGKILAGRDSAEDILEIYKTNYKKAMEWLFEEKPVHCHEIIEDWKEESFVGDTGNFIGFSGPAQIYGQVRFYAGGFVEIGRSNIQIDAGGVSISIRDFFGAFFEKQMLEQEILARTLQKAKAISEVLGEKFAAVWAFPYYNNRRDSQWQGIPEQFENSSSFKVINALFTNLPFNFVFLKSDREGTNYPKDYPKEFAKQYGPKLGLLTGLISQTAGGSYFGGGGWAGLLKDFMDKLTEENWKVWFYRVRDPSDSTFWKTSSQWEAYNQMRLRNDNAALWSIYEQLKNSLPEGDPLRSKLETELKRLAGLQEVNS